MAIPIPTRKPPVPGDSLFDGLSRGLGSLGGFLKGGSGLPIPPLNLNASNDSTSGPATGTQVVNVNNPFNVAGRGRVDNTSNQTPTTRTDNTDPGTRVGGTEVPWWAILLGAGAIAVAILAKK